VNVLNWGQSPAIEDTQTYLNLHKKLDEESIFNKKDS